MHAIQIFKSYFVKDNLHFFGGKNTFFYSKKSQIIVKIDNFGHCCERHNNLLFEPLLNGRKFEFNNPTLLLCKYCNITFLNIDNNFWICSWVGDDDGDVQQKKWDSWKCLCCVKIGEFVVSQSFLIYLDTLVRRIFNRGPWHELRNKQEIFSFFLVIHSIWPSQNLSD